MTSPTDTDAVWPGHHYDLGASHDGSGANFAVWAPNASTVTLCLFDIQDNETRLDLPEHTLGVWHGYLPGVRPGQHYGFRVSGRWDPAAGHMFNSEKLLLDPYAKAIDRTLVPHPSLAGGTPEEPNPGDTAPYTPRSVVIGADRFDWGDDRRPRVPWRRTVVYEAHVRGFTKLHPDIPEHQRGTFAAMGHPATIGYLQGLGVTSVELLPVQHFLSEPVLSDRGLINYWGYNTVGFFAPHAGYSSSGTRGEQITEFKQMVKELHSAGLEVLLDVVYNHTAEGGKAGPTVGFRGYDDRSYYRHDSRGRYDDVTGCGNTVNASEPQVLQLVMDSLRYWVTEMHVDGFRFDLASALVRNGQYVDLQAPFLAAIQQDPVLREVKLIAEPWDATSEGYLVGRFPPPWCEWNDRFRDGVRDFWRGHAGGVRVLASRFSGSSDLYADDGRLPFASVNFVTAHDGFTLRDLVTYEHKHNEANGERNRDGSDNNRSWNCGAEGETDDVEVNALRQRQAANLLATLLLSTGVPMLTAGDERGRTQGGNNNAFCQDNDTSWVSWETAPDWQHLHDLTRTLLRLRAEHPVLRQRHFFEGTPFNGAVHKDITWLQPSGDEMPEEAWIDGATTTLGVFLAGDAVRAVDDKGERRRDTSYLVWLHAGGDTVDVLLPEQWADHYVEVVRTDAPTSDEPIQPGTKVTLLDHTFALYEAVAAGHP
ncbi:MAG: glycogen debranching protein GlgX [Nocardioidaceae bacterium]|nr:glycogen debranching protein GlgX [Nocardioidaceae bacterium]